MMRDTMFGRLGADIREMVMEQVEYRELLYRMTARDLLLRYKQTVMGFGWAIFMPLLNTAVFSVIFTRVAPIDTGMPYPVFAYCGLLPWNFFASSLRFSATSLTSNASLVTKVYFPREIFPFSAVLVCLVDFAVAATVLAAMMVYYQIGVGRRDLVPARRGGRARGVHGGRGAVPGDGEPVLSGREVPVRGADRGLDVRDVGRVSDRARSAGGSVKLLKLNPMTPIIDAYRAVILVGELPPAGPFAAAAVLSFVCFPGRMGDLSPRRVPVRGEHLKWPSRRIVFDGVWKKFRRGERHDSLRDLDPGAGETPVRPAPDATSCGAEEFWARQGRLVRGQAGRGAGHHRPERRGQVHDAEAPHEDPPADAWRGARSTAASAR